MTGGDAQSVPPVVLWIAAIFRRCSPAADELVMPAANSVAALPMPRCAVRDLRIATPAVLVRHASGGRRLPRSTRAANASDAMIA